MAPVRRDDACRTHALGRPAPTGPNDNVTWLLRPMWSRPIPPQNATPVRTGSDRRATSAPGAQCSGGRPEPQARIDLAMIAAPRDGAEVRK